MGDGETQMIDPALEDDEGAAEAGPSRPDEEDEKLLNRLTRWERLARNHWSDWREEARQCYNFVAGHQWSSDDKASLLEQMRQPVTFNRVGPMVDAVTGAEILNRQEVTFLPRELGDVQVNEVLTAANQWAADLADTEDEESDAFADVVVCGVGWTETRMDYSEDPEGRLVDDRVDPLEMWVDPTSMKRCFADSRYRIRARYREKDELPKSWRKNLPPVSKGAYGVDDVQRGWTGPQDDYDREDEPSAKDDSDANKSRVWVRHIQWWDLEPAYRIEDPMTGEAITVDRKKLKQIAQMFLTQGLRPPEAVKIEQKKHYYAILCGNTILEKGEIEANKFTFNAITGKRDKNKNTYFGIVRAMIDPQMWGNKFFVQIMHILNTAAKGGAFYESDSFANPRKALEDWAKPDAMIEVKRGALAQGAVQERVMKNYPAGLDKIMEFTFNNLPQTSGINMEMLGLVERDQPGVLEAQRKKAGYAILAVFFDSLRRYRKMKGRVRLFMIQNYMSDGRLIRIKGRDNTEQYVPLSKQPGTATYDVVVDEAPMSPNQKEATWQMMMGLMPMLSKMNVPPEIWQTLIEYSPLPSSVSSKINEIINQKASQPPPPDPKLIEMQTKAQIEQQKAQQSMAQSQQQAQLQLFQAQQETQQEAVRSQQELAQDRERHAMEMDARQADVDASITKALISVQQARAQAEAADKKRRAQSSNSG